MDRVAPSARLEAQIAELVSDGLSADPGKIAELGRLGFRLVLQRAIDEEVEAFLGRARYECHRTPKGGHWRTRQRRPLRGRSEVSRGG